jgi:RND family efflux transporter MFP subunit
VLGILLGGCGGKEEEGSEEYAVVERTTLRDIVSQTGEVTPLVKVDVQCEASGRIDTIYVKEGQKVREGDRLLSIDPERLTLHKQKLDLSVSEAKIRRDMAEREYARKKELFETGTVPRSSLEDLESEFKLRDIAYRKQVLERRDIVDQLKETTVEAPMSGVLTHLNVEQGEIVVSATSNFQSGTVIGTIADIENLEVVTQIGEVDYPKLAVGQSVIIRPEAAENVQTGGTIDFISLTARKRNSEELGTFEVRIKIDSVVTGVVPGVNVNVDFVVLEMPDVLAVPAHFVTGRGKRKMVLKVTGEGSERTVEPVNVKTGGTDYRNTEIVSGLQEGDSIVFREESEGGGKPPRGMRGRR